jgi:hypothetical protein
MSVRICLYLCTQSEVSSCGSGDVEFSSCPCGCRGTTLTGLGKTRGDGDAIFSDTVVRGGVAKIIWCSGRRRAEGSIAPMHCH